MNITSEGIVCIILIWPRVDGTSQQRLNVGH